MMKTEYLFIPSACIAIFGIYNILKIKKRLNEIEQTLPTMETRIQKVETIALTLPFKYADPKCDIDF